MVPDSQRLSEEILTTGGKADPKKKEEGEETKDVMIERLKKRIVMLEGVVKELRDDVTAREKREEREERERRGSVSSVSGSVRGEEGRSGVATPVGNGRAL